MGSGEAIVGGAIVDLGWARVIVGGATVDFGLGRPTDGGAIVDFGLGGAIVGGAIDDVERYASTPAGQRLSRVGSMMASNGKKFASGDSTLGQIADKESKKEEIVVLVVCQ